MERNFKKRMRMNGKRKGERRKGEKKKGEEERKNLEWREWHFLKMHNQMHTAPDASFVKWRINCIFLHLTRYSSYIFRRVIFTM